MAASPHPFRALVAAALAALAAAAASVRAQDPPPASIVVLVRDPAGKPVADATGLWLPEPAVELPALGDVEPPRSAVPLRSDVRGVLRTAPPVDGQLRPGAMLVTTHAGLGGIAARISPGAAIRLDLVPMGELTTSSGSEDLTVHAATLLDDGSRLRLPVAHGRSVRLPAGRHEVWLQSGEGWSWHRIDLRPGQSVPLALGGPARELTAPPGARVHPVGWPEVQLLGADRATVTLRGAATTAALLTLLADGRIAYGVPTTAPPTGGTPVRLALVGDERAIADAVVWAVEPTDRGAHRLLARAVAQDSGNFLLPALASHAVVLVTAPDAAPRAVPWPDSNVPQRIELGRGATIDIDCIDAAGRPIEGLRLDYVPDDGIVATASVRSDARGRARLAAVRPGGMLRSSDPRYLNQSIPVPITTATALRFQASAGLSLSGRARLPDGAAAAGAIVTLRDPTGRLRPAERSAVAATDGSFVFAGLHDGLVVVLFGTQQRSGRTWSGKIAHFQVGATSAAELVLRDEDPELLPPRRGS